MMPPLTVIDVQQDRMVELEPGQLFTIPANVRYLTRPQRNRSVNLTFELAAMETIKC